MANPMSPLPKFFSPTKVDVIPKKLGDKLPIFILISLRTELIRLYKIQFWSSRVTLPGGRDRSK